MRNNFILKIELNQLKDKQIVYNNWFLLLKKKERKEKKRKEKKRKEKKKKNPEFFCVCNPQVRLRK